jgi:hypothetical protein
MSDAEQRSDPPNLDVSYIHHRIIGNAIVPQQCLPELDLNICVPQQSDSQASRTP